MSLRFLTVFSELVAAPLELPSRARLQPPPALSLCAVDFQQPTADITEDEKLGLLD
jgi:hypothetical protein